MKWKLQDWPAQVAVTRRLRKALLLREYLDHSGHRSARLPSTNSHMFHTATGVYTAGEHQAEQALIPANLRRTSWSRRSRHC